MSHCDCAVHNQTPKESYDVLRRSKKPGDEPGTGLFLVPAPETGIMEYRKVLAPDPITYGECAKRAVGCVAFKWIANRYKSHAEVLKAVKGKYCSGVICAGGTRCIGGYHCICSPTSNYCH